MRESAISLDDRRMSEKTTVELEERSFKVVELEPNQARLYPPAVSDTGLLKAENGDEFTTLDGGRRAWLFMISACLIEAFLWGNCSLPILWPTHI